MRLCGRHAVHSSDRAGGPLCRARSRASRVCDTRGRPLRRRSARSSRPAAFPRAGWAAGSRPRCGTAELAAVRRSPAVAGAEIAETSSADAIISQGVALSGADALQRAGRDGSGVTIVVLDQAFGAASRLNALAGTELPPLERQHRHVVRRDLRAGRPRLQRQQLAPRRVRQRDRLRHGAGRDLLVHQLPHDRRVRPGRRLHRERAQAEHRRALQLLPVRPLRRHAAGSRRRSTRRPRPACSGSTRRATTARGTGRGPGRTPTATATSTCRATATPSASSWRRPAARPATSPGPGATSDPGSYYHLALYTDPGLTTPALDKNTLQPIQSNGLAALPDPHASMGPGAVSSPGPYYVAVRRDRHAADDEPDGLLPHGPLADGAGHGLELPHARRRGRRVLGRRVRRHHAAARAVLLRGADRRRAPQARHRGAHERAHHARRPGVRRGQRLRRHLRARRPTWAAPRRSCGPRSRPTAAPGSVAQRVRDRLVAQALDVGAPGPGHRVRRRPSAARPRGARARRRPRRRRTRSCAAPSRSRCRSSMRARSACSSSRWTARRSSRRSRRAASSRPPGRPPGSPRARTCSRSCPPTRAATSPPTRSRCGSTTTPPKVRLRSPLRARARAKVKISASVLDVGSGLAARPLITFGDGAKARGFHLAHRYKRPGRYVVSIDGDRPRRQQPSLVRRALRIRAAPGEAAAPDEG